MDRETIGEKSMDLFQRMESYSKNLAVNDGEKALTYREVLDICENNVYKLGQLGIRAGSKVMLQEQNQMDFILMSLSLLMAGCWAVLLPGDIVEDTYKKIADELEAVVIDFNEFDIYSAEKGRPNRTAPVNPQHCGILQPTSGTTSKIKFCIRDLSVLTNEAESFKKTCHIGEKERFMSLNPLCHAFAFGAILMSSFVTGGCVYTSGKFSPWKALKEIQDKKISIIAMVPFMARMLVETRKKSHYDFSSLKYALAGAGSVPEDVSRQFENRFGIFLMNVYGSTEAGGVAIRLEKKPYDSIGKPMIGVAVKIVNENNETVPTGTVGELSVRSTGLFRGYYKEDNMEPFDEDGYFKMGDYAYCDADGYLYLKGRKKWIVNIGGKKVNPVEVEEIIMAFSGIDECVVLGIQNDQCEETLIAFISGDAVDQTALIHHCGEYLESYKIPKRYLQVDHFLRNQSGKIQRNELLNMINKENGE